MWTELRQVCTENGAKINASRELNPGEIQSRSEESIKNGFGHGMLQSSCSEAKMDQAFGRKVMESSSLDVERIDSRDRTIAFGRKSQTAKNPMSVRQRCLPLELVCLSSLRSVVNLMRRQGLMLWR